MPSCFTTPAPAFFFPKSLVTLPEALLMTGNQDMLFVKDALPVREQSITNSFFKNRRTEETNHKPSIPA